MQPSLSSPSNLSREEIALIEVGHTTVSPSLARACVVAFVAMIMSAPLIEVVLAGRITGDASRTPWSILAARPRDVATGVWARPGEGAWARIMAANRTALANLTSFESSQLASRWLCGSTFLLWGIRCFLLLCFSRDCCQFSGC